MSAERLFPGPYMERGSKGPAVATLQIILKALGFGKDIVVDRDFGEKTEMGVSQYQEARGLRVDGKCGPDTRKMILVDTGIDLNNLPADLFAGETTLNPSTPW